ncbi:MAG TPA: shikimate kinase [Candidatus Dormibacteraeota bacterium]|nr:shikimate kinase [Candidatus Dormibacteraeota bacterium]
MTSTPFSGAPANRRLICLIGFMGSGKTTVGALLARQLAWRFVDLDARIEEAAGLRITEIFERLGEPTFREIEHQQLANTLGQAAEDATPVILALGGGTFAQSTNITLLRDAGAALVWLDCPMDLLLARCVTMTGRPLFSDEHSFRQLYEQRLPFYRQATYRVDAGGAPRHVLEQILSLGILQPAAGVTKSTEEIIQP